jgi:hypothetical protein
MINAIICILLIHMLVRTSRLKDLSKGKKEVRKVQPIYAANANAQLTAKPKAAPKADTLRLLEALLKSSEPSDEVPLPLLWPFPPAEEVEFELVEEEPEPTVELPGMVEFEAGETEPDDEEACS